MINFIGVNVKCMQCMVLCDGRGICDFFALKVTHNKGHSKVIILLHFHFIVAMVWPKSVEACVAKL